MTRFAFLLALFACSFATRAEITDGLIAHYKFDETVGNTTADTVRGASGTGTLLNFTGGQWGTGIVGNCVTLNGSNNWISTPLPIPDNATVFSFTGWVWATSRPTWASIAKNWGDASVGQFHLGLDNVSGALSNYLTNVVPVRESPALPLNSWQHVAVTYDGSTHSLYRNGVLIQALPNSVALRRLNGVLALGVKTRDSGLEPSAAGVAGYWSGKFDDFGLWNRGLSAEEVASIYQKGLSGLTLSAPQTPVISNFVATPPNVPSGGSATLSWTTSAASTLTLHGGTFVDQDVTGQTSISTGPLTVDTTYTLTATSGAGSVSKDVLVGVGASVLQPVISEFLAEANVGAGITDPNNKREDWVEIHNPNATYTLDLSGYFLTDNPGTLDKWTFPPNTIVPPNGYLIIFCTEKNLPLHASFKLSTEGEYLALVKPDGTILQQFAPLYPPQSPDVSYSSTGYLATPTPGAANSGPAGPFVTNVTENPPPPLDGDALVIEAIVQPQPGTTVTGVSLLYRVMYAAEISLPMTVGADGRFRATIPASASTPGQMVRWRVTATDSAGRDGKWPLYRDPADSPEYLGTVVQNPAITSPLPIIHRFTNAPASIDADPGTRCSIFFNGEFFDNLEIRLRGLTSRNFPKKSHKIEMNPGYKFRFKEGVPRVTEFDLNTTYTDKSYVRAALTSEHQLAVGLPSPEIFPVRVQQNNAFYSVALFVENPDEEFLVRHGLDPDGAFYKAPMNNYWDSATPFDKKTRPYEGKEDLAAFITKLKLTGFSLELMVFDEVDIPGMINYMATTCITQNIDASDKNHFAYRDTNGTREWTMLPWDLDLTFGPTALNTDNISALYPNSPASHPYIGASPYLLSPGKRNWFLEAIVNTPRTRAMLDRRIRTLSDAYLATNWFSTRIDQLVPKLNADVLLDKAQWGGNAHFPGATYTLQAANDRIKTEYLAPRLTFLNGGGTVGLPTSQPAAPTLNFGTIEANPITGNQGQEYIEIVNSNAFGVDISGWTIEGQIAHTFKPGTVIPPGDTLYLSPNVVAFRGRQVFPTGQQGLFVQGNYAGQLSARGGSLTMRTAGPNPVTIATTTYPDTSSDVQRFLRITEVNYAPLGGGGHPAGNYEFIEFRNTGPGPLELTGVTLSGGIDFDFTDSAITTLNVGAYVLVVKNSDAFNARYGAGLPIAGQFTGSLDNRGDRIHLRDGADENVLDFTYQPAWHPLTGGIGYTLTIRNAAAVYTTWDFAPGWKTSGKLHGTPGGPDTGDTDQDGLPDDWELANGLSSANPNDADGDLDGDGQSNRDEFTAGTLANNPASRFRVESVIRDETDAIVVTFIAQANRSYAVQRKATLHDGAWTTVQETSAAAGVRTITFTESVSGGSGFYRVVTPAP